VKGEILRLGNERENLKLFLLSLFLLLLFLRFVNISLLQLPIQDRAKRKRERVEPGEEGDALLND
jgi:hypothetical protein